MAKKKIIKNLKEAEKINDLKICKNAILAKTMLKIAKICAFTNFIEFQRLFFCEIHNIPLF